MTSYSLFSVLSLSASIAGLSFAQDASSIDADIKTLEPVLVTGAYLTNEKFSGTKTLTPVIDVPQSLSVVSAARISEQAFSDIGDILRYTPGASIGQGEGHRDQITIRGQSTTADFFIDGLRDDVEYFRPLYNIEQVEVLRGSNAMIFGRGGGGGIINRASKSPDAETRFTDVSASLDTFSELSLALDHNAVVNEVSAFRVNAFAEALANHRDQFDGDRFAVNPTFSTKLAPDTHLLLSYEYVNDDRVVDRGVPSVGNAPLEGFEDTIFGDPNANRTSLAAHIARARIDHEFSDTLTANATLQYADYDKLYQNLFPVGFDLIAGTVTFDGYRDTTTRQNLILQGNVVSNFYTGPVSHTLLIGAEYGDQQSDNARRDALFADSTDNQISFAFSDPLNIPNFSFPVFNRDRGSSVQFASIYIQDQVDLGRHFKLIGGLRFDQFQIDVIDQIEIANGAGDGNNGLLSRTDEEISPRLGLIYKPVDSVSAYVSYSKSFLPRSGDQFLTLSPSTEAAAPEVFENIELGLKWDIRPNVSLTTAVFQLERENGTAVDPNNVGNSILIGTQTEGLEIQLSGALTNWWRLDAGYSYLSGSEFGVVSGARSDLSQVPENMLSVWNRFDVNDHLGFGMGMTYQDAQYASFSNTVKLPDFTRLDAAVFYQFDSGLAVQLNLENLLDEDYYPAAHNDNNISTGAPLSARLTVRTRF
ncbi:MAG: TonB-dependent siderophore receptor [Alphaproteobacteria bacterium]|nr:TonB-dependent siderophore receptor [Alphaproteobacteria bacterium]MBU2082802.1 TonB-dependent siderophore receptor [Alphaproteobacteria bacterium]MBU2142906.1 TonB-dependent siderophore receptor [Alphaproteobacteria bacterium]MBU2197937.1 TonB-dependent siderophore receptor [Alphaproteobacteria bacterium]